MKRLLPRPPRRRANSPQGTEDTPPGTEAQPAEVQPAVPAGAEPADPSAPPQPSFRNRGRLRRRLRFLRRVRELGFRDLGGLVFDQHKFDRQNADLVRGKVAALAAVDAELRALEQALGEKRDVTELREPGISACPRCGTLHGSDARFCPSCGLALTGARTIAADVGEGVHGSRAPPAARLPAPDRVRRARAAGAADSEPDRDGRERSRREPDRRRDPATTPRAPAPSSRRPSPGTSDRPDA